MSVSTTTTCSPLLPQQASPRHPRGATPLQAADVLPLHALRPPPHSSSSLLVVGRIRCSLFVVIPSIQKTGEVLIIVDSFVSKHTRIYYIYICIVQLYNINITSGTTAAYTKPPTLSSTWLLKLCMNTTSSTLHHQRAHPLPSSETTTHIVQLPTNAPRRAPLPREKPPQNGCRLTTKSPHQDRPNPP